MCAFQRLASDADFNGERASTVDLARRKDEKCEAAYQDLLFRHYQFYQFYANMPFALAFTYLAWAFASPDVTPERAVVGRHAIGRYAQKVSDLLGVRSAAA